MLTVFKLHQALLLELRKHRENIVFELPRIIVEHFDDNCLAVYYVILATYEEMSDTMQHIESKRQFMKRMQNYNSHKAERLKVYSLCAHIKCVVSRFARYHLLMREFALHCPGECVEQTNLILRRLEQVRDRFNALRREKEEQ